jgi:adenine phosphoribosyltransferase
LATGGTVLALANLCKTLGFADISFSFIGEIPFLKGRDKLTAYSNNIYSLVSF